MATDTDEECDAFEPIITMIKKSIEYTAANASGIPVTVNIYGGTLRILAQKGYYRPNTGFGAAIGSGVANGFGKVGNLVEKAVEAGSLFAVTCAHVVDKLTKNEARAVIGEDDDDI